MIAEVMNSGRKTNYAFAISVVGGLFFVFGFVTWLNSVLIPFLKQVCHLTDFQAYFVTLAFYISYTVMAIPASAILKRTGFTKGMSVGLITMAVGSLIFIPAAQARSFPLFLSGLFTQGAGLTLLQTASNPYITILGPIESAAKRISIMGICNKVAGMIGIFVLNNLLFSDTQTLSKKIESLSGNELAAELDILASRLIIPYIIMALVLIGLAIMIQKAHLPEVNTEQEITKPEDEINLKGRTSALQFPYLMLGVLCIFVYVGVEVIAIDTLSLYGQYQGFDLNTAGKFAIYSLIALTAGYLLGIILIPKYLSQRIALIICATLGFIFTILALVATGWVSIAFIILLSFANALMWPSIWPLAINKLGRFTKSGSALLIMGIAGGSLLPLVYGALADTSSRQIAYWILLPRYVYILFYAARGYRAGLKV
ncbi:MAG TPA: sugar MFS transporter [Chitinophagaceae bacterium]|nr:sugar MFS transporter [Chitinophagaceae bacterium]